MSNSKDIAAAESDGWVLECESPLELRHPATGSFASGLAAELVLAQYISGSSEQTKEEIWAALLNIQHEANRIISQGENWGVKYELIFKPGLSKQAFKLCSELGSSLDYCDPDTSYEEDVMAFVTALNSKVCELAPNMATETQDGF
jgi:hypothetical protein